MDAKRVKDSLDLEIIEDSMDAERVEDSLYLERVEDTLDENANTLLMSFLSDREEREMQKVIRDMLKLYCPYFY